jgi:antitoxin (DNA-binding transcriptional repressor) of toxin-antitoxin stability system
MQVTLQYATEHLDELASAADNGEDVEIARPEKPSLKLIVSTTVPIPEPNGRRILSALRGQLIVPTEEESQSMDPVWNVPERPRSELFGSLAGRMEMSADWNSDETNAEIERQFEGEAEPQDQWPR